MTDMMQSIETTAAKRWGDGCYVEVTVASDWGAPTYDGLLYNKEGVVLEAACLHDTEDGALAELLMYVQADVMDIPSVLANKINDVLIDYLDNYGVNYIDTTPLARQIAGLIEKENTGD